MTNPTDVVHNREHSPTQEETEMTETTTRTWPTREEWETRERALAESMIETGHDYWDDSDGPRFSEAERAEVDKLAPEAIKVIRRTCGRIERSLRSQHPLAGELAKGITERSITMEAIHRLDAAIDALSGADRDAYDTLSRVGYIRRTLNKSWGYGPFDRPSISLREYIRYESLFSDSRCPQLDRLRQLNDEAVARWREGNRARGRKLLAAWSPAGRGNRSSNTGTASTSTSAEGRSYDRHSASTHPVAPHRRLV
jgi:hypothetical protein